MYNEYRQMVIGDYVFTPIRNAFNEKTSVWISKEGMTVAAYCFTIGVCGVSYEEGLKDYQAYIKYFQEKFENS